MYYIGLSLSNDTKQAIEEFKPTIVHIANPDPLAGMCLCCCSPAKVLTRVLANVLTSPWDGS